MIDCVTVASFSGRGGNGNRHVVIFDSQYAHGGEEFFKRKTLHFQCVPPELMASNLVLLIYCEETQKYCVRFYDHRNEIRRCGSGSIAAAYFIHQYLDINSEVQLCTQAGDVVVGHKDASYYFSMRPLPFRNAVNFSMWQSIVNFPIKNGVGIGGGREYCLLELEDAQAVKRCKVNSTKLSLCSKRALIVTAKGGVLCKASGWPRISDDVDYVFRYFLPQYGKYEDAATGSANAIAASYWQKRLSKRSVESVQLSKEGGWFCSEKMGKTQRVYGTVKELHRQELNI